MHNLLRQHISAATLFQIGADLLWLVAAMCIALYFERRPVREFDQLLSPALLFALLIVSINGALGAYRRDRKLPLWLHARWLLAASIVAVPAAYLASLVLPGGDAFRDILGVTALAAFAGRPPSDHQFQFACSPMLFRNSSTSLGFLISKSLRTSD